MGQPGRWSPPRGTTGLFHAAILYPARADLADAVRRVLAAGVQLDGASDHGVSEAVYLRDRTATVWSFIGTGPKRNGLADGGLAMVSDPLDLDDCSRRLVNL